jgi:hypothetical protein
MPLSHPDFQIWLKRLTGLLVMVIVVLSMMSPIILNSNSKVLVPNALQQQMSG